MKVIMFSGARAKFIRSTTKTAEIRATISDILYTEASDLIIVGCATGVDEIVRGLCKGSSDFTFSYAAQFTADWFNHGKSAGMIRNREMCEAMVALGGSKLYAFPAPQSIGTWSCIRTALSHNIDVTISPILYL